MSSSRLKRTLDRAEEGQYGNLTESFVSIGTALPALTDNKKDKNEFKPQWEQEVYDEQGRRRFHGAFTGGFSAGYFNTVGSKEGWTPSTFKSSRSNRVTGQGGQSVADAAKAFMDEEDLAELASSRTLETNTAYASSSSSRPGPGLAPQPGSAGKADYDPLLGLFGGLSSSTSTSTSTSEPPPPAATGAFDATLASLIQPSSSRVGLKLMRKMGWRDGQGVGPRVTYSQRKKQAAELGVTLPSEGEEEETDEARKHLYAPLDRPLILVKGTSASADRGWGLGYKPGQTLDARLRSEGGGGAGAGGGMRRPHFELDDEDGDVYGMGGAGPAGLGERERRALGAYDAMDEEEEGLDRIRRTNGRGSAARLPPKRSSAAQQDFLDGTRVLPGFVLQTEPVAGPSTSKLPPPPPPGWQPNPSRLWKENEPPSGSASDVKGKGRQLDAEERGTLLGEQAPPPPPSVPKSVFDYLSAKSRERLATVTGSGAPSPPPSSAMTGANAIPVGPGKGASASTPPPPPPTPEPDAELFVPSLDRPTALAALRGFQPYSAASTSPDPIKQARYTLYLQYQSTGTASTTSSPFGPRVLPNGKTQTVGELNRELSEYVQAARVFKPVSGMLGSRFQTSQSGSLDVPKVEPGLWQPPPKTSSTSSASTSTNPLLAAYGDASSNSSFAAAAPLKPPEPALTPAQQAARAGNFGPGTTRTTSQFRPAKLLCKRFGVRDPFEPRDGAGGGAEDEGVGRKWGEASATGFGPGGSGGAGGGGTKEAVGEAALQEMMNSAGFKRFQMAAEEEAKVGEDSVEVAKGVFETPASAFSSAGGAGEGGQKKAPPRAKPTLETVGLGDDEAQGEEIVEEKKAPADIFAAIFADSDDEEDDEDQEGEADATAGGAQPAEAAEAATVLSVDPVDPYAPKPSSAAAAPADEPATPLTLDTVASYRPSFVSSSSRSAADPSSTTASTLTTTKEKKEKKSKSKRKAGALSFDVDDGGGDEGQEERSSASSRKKVRRDREKDKVRDGDGKERSREKDRDREKEKEKKRDRSRSREQDSAAAAKRSRPASAVAAEDEDEWGEAASEVHPSILASMQKTASSAGAGGQEEGGKKGRMRAADLY